jgi:hypothetical protein
MPVEIRVIFRGEPHVNALDAGPEPMDEVFAGMFEGLYLQLGLSRAGPRCQ